MLATQLADLLAATPAGVADALAVVDGFDDTLVTGLGRLGADQHAAVFALADVLAASPLGPVAREAAEKLATGSVSDDVLATLAGARAAVLGAVHDALLGAVDLTVGRERSAWDEGMGSAGATAGEAALGGCRSWLRELAIVGWRGAEDELVSSSAQAREAALAVPPLRRLAVLLDGLAAELLAAGPVGVRGRLPVRRWADLWTRGVLLARHGAWAADGSAGVSTGRLLPLGAEVAEHGTAVRLVVHAVLETAGERPRLMRTAVTAAKVDTIVGPAVWRLLETYPVLVGALVERRAVEFSELVLLSTGDLVWREDAARLAEAADPFVTARVLPAGALAPPVAPLDRHPVRICEPVLLEGYTATLADDGQTLTFDLGGSVLGVEVEPAAADPAVSLGPLAPAVLAGSSACLGLLRWDEGRWLLRPLGVQAVVKKKPLVAHVGDWARGAPDPRIAKARAKNEDAVPVLRERAGRLLRG
ncbi:hypothetical protein [Pseudofrankia inefficax]|uniref:Uncharacterized protein n=1 Tax=Pseudofrankia inefficax (strain DSM 45817 / CECT 9037 / DDB 130130 / EuI1c) TaxID=298654 RepID=E3J8L4_PSEI1|nr:hypothetical protein [Pseudofrankia inefficax]ADP78457.1 hypothetical protein FraEuI1c_0371 [Pseudofrankia inefficax]